MQEKLPRKHMTSTKTTANKVAVSKEEYRAFHVNRVKTEFDKLRGKSKTSTFALQYAGTPITLVKNSGFTQQEAEQIYNNYHAAYTESTKYTEARKAQAAIDGYLSVAFNLRVRTPLLNQVVWGSDAMPREAEAEARTVGNAISQSYGLLNNRAANAFMEKVRQSKYCQDILPIAMIHDAFYLTVRDDAEVVAWVNKELTEAMSWQDLVEIAHPVVKLGAQLDIFWPDWAHPITLPDTATAQEITNICAEAKHKHLKETK